MDQNRLTSVTRSLTRLPSRRDVLRGVVGAGLGVGGVRLPEAAMAKKKRKKTKKARPNAYGCLSVGVACKNADQCCSGICQGKKGKRRCRAHGNGTCNQASSGLCHPENPTIEVCNSDICACVFTTAGSNFCANANAGTVCTACKNDADCLALGLPAGSACAPFSEGGCASGCEAGTVCVIPCGVELPEPTLATGPSLLRRRGTPHHAADGDE